MKQQETDRQQTNKKIKKRKKLNFENIDRCCISPKEKWKERLLKQERKKETRQAARKKESQRNKMQTR